MHRVVSLIFASLLVAVLLAPAAFSQDASPTVTATCNYDEDHQLSVEMQAVTINPKRPVATQIPYGRVWAPGGKPLTLFTNARVKLGSMELPLGAYTMFVIPSPKQWTLIVSRSTNMTGLYQEDQDLVRVPMETGELPSAATNLQISFQHVTPNQCTFRIDLDKFGHFVSFEKR